MTQKLYLDDPTLKSFDAKVVAVLPNGVALDRTAFYAMSGGQAGDIGILNDVPVTDTIKDKENPEHVIHVVAHPEKFSVGQSVKGQIDWARRWNHMRMHTALHLLCSLIKGDVTGGAVNADKSRLDFNIDASDLDKEILTKQLNDLIIANHPVNVTYVDETELDRNPDLVRTLSVKPPRGLGTVRMVTIGDVSAPIDRQPCGGTHVAHTGEIGAITVTKIENKGKMNKRVILTLNECLEQTHVA